MSATLSAFLHDPWDRLDDHGLLTHFRSDRGVRFFPVVDPEETKISKIDALVNGCFEFNDEKHRMSDPINWLNNPSADVEWQILLHKFYYAVGLGLAFERSGDNRYAWRWMQLIDSWISTTPVGFIAPDVTGRRVQNWIYSLHYFITSAASDISSIVTPAFLARMLMSLHSQVEFLCANLTPKRNHRTIELTAIFLAGVVFPEMRNARSWRSFALEEMVVNLHDDLLSDGVHCELSTDYHHLVIKNGLNVRRLASLNNLDVPRAFDEALIRGLEFSLHVHKPDGIVPSLSDGDARSYLDLLKIGAQLYQRDDMLYVATLGSEGECPRQRIAHFPVGGYSVLRSDWGDQGRPYTDAHYLVFDYGPIGEGNHGHFDCLSFELAAFGRSLIVDPGRYTYSEAGETNWRVRFRGTAAHNTVCVDGRHQTRYEPRLIKPGTRHPGGSLRHRIAGPAPDSTLLEHHHQSLVDLLQARAISHEYDAVHDRCIVFVNRRYWIISDWLRAPTIHHYSLNFQLSDEAWNQCEVTRVPFVRVDSPGLTMLQPELDVHEVSLQPSWVSSRYGEKRQAPMLVRTAFGAAVDFDTVLIPARSRPELASISAVPVMMIGSRSAEGLADRIPGAWQIVLEVDGERSIDCWFHARDSGHRHWRIGCHEFIGRWLLMRLSSDDQVVGFVSHPGARLMTAERSGWSLQ